MNVGKALLYSFAIALGGSFIVAKACEPEVVSAYTGVEVEKVESYQKSTNELGDSAKRFGKSIADIVKQEEKDEDGAEGKKESGPKYDPQMMKDLQELLETYEQLKKDKGN